MMNIIFEENGNVAATYDGVTVKNGPEPAIISSGNGLNPFQMLLFSIGSCEAVFMKMFYDNHRLSLQGAMLDIDFVFNPDGTLGKSVAHITPGPALPENRQQALVSMLKNCKVKKHLRNDIEFDYVLRTANTTC